MAELLGWHRQIQGRAGSGWATIGPGRVSQRSDGGRGPGQKCLPSFGRLLKVGFGVKGRYARKCREVETEQNRNNSAGM